MNGLEYTCLCSVVAVAAVFIFTAGRLGVYWLCITIVCVATAIAGIAMNGAAEWEQWITLLSGLALLSFGLSGVRIMIERSVSLEILQGVRNNKSVEKSFQEHLKSRPADIVKHGLGIQQDGRIKLTAFGNVIAMVTSLCYRTLGLQQVSVEKQNIK